MTAQSTQTPVPTATPDSAPLHGAEIVVPLNRLKPSKKNARKVPHSTATLEALAASIRVKGVLQSPVVEVEFDADGTPTGDYAVTIGEGRRLALRMLVKRKAIKRDHPVRVIVDRDNDAHEISLDENVTREAMHPADQFEAFKRVADEKGWGAEEIAARFGTTPAVVRQRMRLAAVAPELMTAYREETLTLDQLMAFAVSEDHDRQRQVFDQVGPYTQAYVIRRAMTEAKVRADDRRARFVGVEAYAEAGGGVLRDLFTEDGGGWFEDVTLLDRLVSDKLVALAEEVREREGWKWTLGQAEFPHGGGYGRVWPQAVERTEAEATLMAVLSAEYDGIVAEAEDDGLTPAQDARLEEIETALRSYGPDTVYRPEDLARSGVVVTLGHDGMARFERGLVRPQDALQVSEPEADEASDSKPADASAPDGGDRDSGDAPPTADEAAPLSEKLVMDLTAHRTAGLRAALAAAPVIALTTVVHALALQVFHPGHGQSTPLQLRLSLFGLERHAPGVEDAPAGRALAARLEDWAARLPDRPAELWGALVALPGSDLLDLLACCAALGLNAVRDPHDRRPAAWAQSEVLATALGLDMTTSWTATASAYFSRVAKARVLDAVSEATSPEEAGRIAGFKKTDMAEAAERLVEGRGWLPKLLRTAPAAPPADDPEAEAQAPEPTPSDTAPPDEDAPEAGDARPPRDDPDAYPFAAE